MKIIDRHSSRREVIDQATLDTGRDPKPLPGFDKPSTIFELQKTEVIPVGHVLGRQVAMQVVELRVLRRLEASLQLVDLVVTKTAVWCLGS